MSVKKKIAVFGVKGFPGFGGASRANENIVNYLKDKYDYTIYGVNTHTDKGGHYNGYYQKVFKGFKGKRLNTLVYYIKSVFHALFIENYDLVQLNHTSSGFIIPLLRLKYKVVSTARGIIPKNDNKWNKLDKFIFDISANLFFKFSNIVISVSNPHINIFNNYTNKKIIYIPNGINFQTENVLLKNNKEYILFAAGRIISLKGAHTLLESLNIIEYEGEAVFIGSLEHTPNYKKHLFKLGANLNINYLGLIKEKELLFEKIRDAKLFIFPSFNEGMSNMLLEVASLKTPLICSDILENKAVFNDNEVLYFETGNPEDLGSKIEWALLNYSIMQEKAESAYLKLKKEYLWKDIAKRYSVVYESLLNQ